MASRRRRSVLSLRAGLVAGGLTGERRSESVLLLLHAALVVELAGDVLPACGGFVGLQVRVPLLRAISDVGFVGFFFRPLCWWRRIWYSPVSAKKLPMFFQSFRCGSTVVACRRLLRR
jgi:hypothetical protein